MNVGKTTVYEAFSDVVNALSDTLNDYIKFPSTEAETTACIAALLSYQIYPT